jgi:hypothetical protein
MIGRPKKAKRGDRKVAEKQVKKRMVESEDDFEEGNEKYVPERTKKREEDYGNQRREKREQEAFDNRRERREEEEYGNQRGGREAGRREYEEGKARLKEKRYQPREVQDVPVGRRERSRQPEPEVSDRYQPRDQREERSNGRQVRREQEPEERSSPKANSNKYGNVLPTRGIQRVLDDLSNRNVFDYSKMKSHNIFAVAKDLAPK